MKFPFFESVFRPSPKVAQSKNPRGSSLPLRFFSVTTLGDNLNTNPKIREFRNVTGIVMVDKKETPVQGLYTSEQSIRGGTKATWAFFIFLVVFAYLVWAIVPYYYYHFELSNQAKVQATKTNKFTNEQIRANIWKKVQELDIPLESAEDIQIYRQGNQINIDMEYYEVFYIGAYGYEYDVYSIPFEVHVSEPIVGKRR